MLLATRVPELSHAVAKAAAWDDWLLVGAQAAALGLLLVVGFAALRADKRSLAWAALSCCLAVIAVSALLLRLPPSSLPASFISVLSEGNGGRNVSHVYGTGVRAGPSLGALVRVVAADGVLPIRAMVHLNLCLAAINVALFFGIARFVLKHALPALGLTLVFALNPSMRAAATSELPTQLLILWFLAGAVATLALARPTDYPGWLREASLWLLGLAAVFACLARSEALFIGVPALVVGFLFARRGAAYVESLTARGFSWLRRAAASPPRRHLPWVLGCAALMLVGAWSGYGRLEWTIAALNPINPSFVSLPFFLGQLLPLGVVLLFLLGMLHAARRPFWFLLLPLTLLIQYRLYHSASHYVAFELFRYTGWLLAGVMLLSLFGWRELASIAERRGWPQSWRSWALCGLGLLMVGPLHGASDLFPRAAPILRDQQRDVHGLIKVIESYPECAIVSKVVSEIRRETPESYEYVFFGGAVNGIMALPSAEQSLAQAALRAAPRAPCVVFYRGLDCNRLSGNCEAEVEGLTPLYVERHPSRPYSDPDEYGAHWAVLELGAFRLPPVTGR